MMTEEKQFGVVDFVIFVGMLAVTVVIGGYYAYKDRKTNSVDNYYFGGRNMSPIPIGLSMSVTFISSITVLAYPVHAYLYGTVIMWFGIAYITQSWIGCLYYIPLFRRLKIASVYEYIEMRFNSSLRKFASIVIILIMIVYMGTTVYLTSLALNAVTPMGVTLSILLTSGICTLYTAMGGMKAVVWADTFQTAILVAGTLAVLIKGAIVVGGMGVVWEALERGNRNNFWSFNPDPTLKHSVWSIMIGMGIGGVGAMCTNQAIVQRYQSCRTKKDARIAAVVAVVPLMLVTFISVLNGCVMYAYYEGCDPTKNKQLDKIDQTVPYMVLQMFEDAPGLPGLFVSAAYSGMLSTVSSGINSLAALILEDIIKPRKPNMTEMSELAISKFLSALFGVVTVGTAFLTKVMGTTVIQLMVSLGGSLGGPILGIFTVGIFFPWTNSAGAIVGVAAGTVTALWITIGSILHPNMGDILPLSVDQCPIDVTVSVYNYSDVISSIVVSGDATTAHVTDDWTTAQVTDSSKSIYSLSYMYIGAIGLVVTTIVALAASFITGKNDPKDMDPNLFLPIFDNERLPEKVRKFFRFGVPEIPQVEEKIADVCGKGSMEKLPLENNFRRDTSCDDDDCEKNFPNLENEKLINRKMAEEIPMKDTCI